MWGRLGDTSLCGLWTPDGLLVSQEDSVAFWSVLHVSCLTNLSFPWQVYFHQNLHEWNNDQFPWTWHWEVFPICTVQWAQGLKLGGIQMGLPNWATIAFGIAINMLYTVAELVSGFDFFICLNFFWNVNLKEFAMRCNIFSSSSILRTYFLQTAEQHFFK